MSELLNKNYRELPFFAFKKFLAGGHFQLTDGSLGDFFILDKKSFNKLDKIDFFTNLNLPIQITKKSFNVDFKTYIKEKINIANRRIRNDQSLLKYRVYEEFDEILDLFEDWIDKDLSKLKEEELYFLSYSIQRESKSKKLDIKDEDIKFLELLSKDFISSLNNHELLEGIFLDDKYNFLMSYMQYLILRRDEDDRFKFDNILTLFKKFKADKNPKIKIKSLKIDRSHLQPQTVTPPKNIVDVAFLQIMGIVDVLGSISKFKFNKIMTKLSQAQRKNLVKKLDRYNLEEHNTYYVVKNKLQRNPFSFESLFKINGNLAQTTNYFSNGDELSQGFVAVGYPQEITKDDLNNIFTADCDFSVFIDPLNPIDASKYLKSINKSEKYDGIIDNFENGVDRPFGLTIYYKDNLLLSENNISHDSDISNYYEDLKYGTANNLRSNTDKLINLILDSKVICKMSINYQKNHIKSMVPLNIDYLGGRKIVVPINTLKELRFSK